MADDWTKQNNAYRAGSGDGPYVQPQNFAEWAALRRGEDDAAAARSSWARVAEMQRRSNDTRREVQQRRDASKQRQPRSKKRLFATILFWLVAFFVLMVLIGSNVQNGPPARSPSSTLESATGIMAGGSCARPDDCDGELWCVGGICTAPK